MKSAALFTSEVESVVGYWLDWDEYSFERWDLIPGSVFVNLHQKTIRFGMTAIGPDVDETFQVVIRDGLSGLTLKSDRWEEADWKYPLEVFESPHKILFVFTGKESHFYLHVECPAETPNVEVKSPD